MDSETSYAWRRQLMWGLLLIAVGIAIILDRLEMFEVGEIWHYWPLVMVVFGVNKMIGFPTARDFSSGMWTALVGLWLFATFEGMFGLTFRNSWPFLIIVWGLQMVIEPLIRARFESNQESIHEK